MSTQREFLQLQLGQIADITFKFPTGLKKEGQFGTYYLYSVFHDGKEKLLKATERLEKELRKIDVKVKQPYSIYKETVHPPKGEPLTVLRIVENKPAQQPNQPPAVVTKNPPAHPTPAASPIPPGNQTTAQDDFTGDKKVMFQSILDAVDITSAIGGIDWRNTDIEKIGVSLFMSRTGQLSPVPVFSNGNGNNHHSDIPF